MISPNEHGWAAYNWFPAAEAAGIRKLATVLSINYFNGSQKNRLKQWRILNVWKFGIFHTPEEALNWLTQKED